MNSVGPRELYLPVLALLAALLMAGGAIYYTSALLMDAQLALAQQEGQLKEARMRLQKSGEERETIVQYLGRYRELQRIGFAGDEQRFNWLDGLRLANERVDLFGVDYQIGAQAAYAYANELNPGDVALNQSVMTMRLRLLHEEDLLRFFHTLRDAGSGTFAIDECSITRIDTSGAIRYQPNLAAECKISWITARPRRAEGRP